MAASPYGTHPDDMDEGVSETKDDNNEKLYKEQDEKSPDVPYPVDMEEGDEKEAAWPDNTPPDDMEEGVSETKDDKNDILDD